MTVERIAPDAILDMTGLSGVVTVVQDDPDSPDVLYLLASNNNTSGSVRVSFPSPSGSLAAGAGAQDLRVWVRQYDTGQSGTPTARIELWEAGVLVRAGADTDVGTSGTLLSLTWSSSEITSPADLECTVVTTKTGGSPSSRNSVDVGAISWDADVAVAVSSDVTVGAATLTFTGYAPTVTATTVVNADVTAAGPAVLTFTVLSPTVTTDANPVAQAGSLTITGLQPTVEAGGAVSADTTVAGPAVITLTGQQAQPSTSVAHAIR